MDELDHCESYADCPACEDIELATDWLLVVTELVMAGELEPVRLANAVDHWLEVIRWQPA